MKKVILFAGPVGNLLSGDEKEPPKEFRVLKAGWNETTKGKFLFDDEAAVAVMNSYAARGLDKIQVDYEHQSAVPPPGGGNAEKPAAGWFKPEVRNGELWAVDLSWTKKAAGMIAPDEGAPEYRYFSPILFFNDESRRVSALKNLALTNDPAMNGIEAIVAASAIELVAADEDTKETPMSCAECTSLSAKLTAKDAELSAIQKECSALSERLSAFQEKDKEKSASMTTLTSQITDMRGKLISLTGQQTDGGALGTIESWKAKAAQADVLVAEKEAAEMAALTAEMNRILDKASEDKKLTPAMRPFEEQAAKAVGGGRVTKDAVAYLSAKWGAAPAVVAAAAATAPAESEAFLTSADIEACRITGSDPKDLLAFKQDKAKQEAEQRRLSGARA